MAAGTVSGSHSFYFYPSYPFNQMQNLPPTSPQEWNIEVQDPQQRDILIAQLSELGFDGFEEISGNLKACGNPENIAGEEARALLTANKLNFEVRDIAPQNWNALWEASFEPVCIGDFCRIRAHFHPSEAGYTHEICITPKMSFGTGHHATTRQMIAMMQDLDFSGKQVLDFGAGTGVLAILAGKLGAANVLALENDPGAVENARENVQQNACTRVEALEGSLEQAGEQPFDIVLANINRNILLHYAPGLAARTSAGGQLLLSGILREDMPLLRDAFEAQGFHFAQHSHEGNWACLRFTKKQQ